MKPRYETAQQAIEANPEHPVVIHGLFCRDRCNSRAREERINNIILSHFNK